MKKLFLVLCLSAGMINLQANQKNEQSFYIATPAIFNDNDFKQKLKQLTNFVENKNPDNFANSAEIIRNINTNITNLFNYINGKTASYYTKDLTLQQLSILQSNLEKFKEFLNSRNIKDQYDYDTYAVKSTYRPGIENRIQVIKNYITERRNSLDTLSKDNWDLADDSTSEDHDKAFNDYKTVIETTRENIPDFNKKRLFIPKRLNDYLNQLEFERHLEQMKLLNTAALQERTNRLNNPDDGGL